MWGASGTEGGLEARRQSTDGLCVGVGVCRSFLRGNLQPGPAEEALGRAGALGAVCRWTVTALFSTFTVFLL